MTTLDGLVAADPDPTSGRPTDIPAGAGAQWRFGVWAADPEAGSSIEWHDLTGYVTGALVHHGAESPHASPRASWAELALRADDDRFAPWNEDTSSTFGVHVRLGAGLLMRGGLFRVAGGDVTHTLIRFTGRVEHWGDSSAALGRIRRHRVVVRDLATDLVRTKLPADTEHSLTSRIAFIAGYYPFGISLYCADTLDEEPVLEFPASDPYPSAATALDEVAMPGGLVWYVNRRGRLIMRPQIGDTWHSDLIGAGATGTLWTDPGLTIFSWAPSIDGGVAYVVEPDDGAEPFGIDDDEQTVRNDIDITVPDDVGYQVDDPGSIDRYGVHSLPMTWTVRNDRAADDMLARLAYASKSARPLIVNERDTGFTQALRLNWGDPVMIRHTSRPGEGRPIVEATGRCRRTIDEITPLPGGRIRWRLSIDVDVDATESTLPLLPPEGLHVEELEDGRVVFSWTNPSQDPAPTVTQVRMMGLSTHWLEVGYPLTAFSWLYLDPDTPYRFEVRYLRVVDGLVTAVSPAATLDFTTPEPDDEPLTPPWEGGDPPVECTTAPALEEAPFDDESLIVFAPLWCPPGKIIEAVTELEATPGPALAGFMFDEDDNVALITDADAGPVVYGESPLLEGVNAGDLAIGCDVTIGDQDTTTLFEAGGLRIGAQLWGDGWRPRAVAYMAGGGDAQVAGDEIPLDETHRIMATWERETGTLTLYVDGEPVNDVSAGEERELVNALPVWWAALPASSAITNCAAWNTLVTPGVAGLELDWDATVSDSIDYTIGSMTPVPRADYVEWLDLVAGVPIEYGPGPGLTYFWPSRTINGRPAMEGDGGDTSPLPTASIDDLAGRAQIAYGDVLLIAAVFQADDPATTRGIIRKAGGGNAQGMWGLAWTESGDLELSVRDGGSNRRVRAAHDVTQPTVAIAILDWRTTSRQAVLRANGVQLGSLSYTGSTSLIGERVLSPAQYYDATNARRGDGAFGQFRVYRRTNSGTFSNDEIAQIEAELMTKWGISS